MESGVPMMPPKVVYRETTNEEKSKSEVVTNQGASWNQFA
jgi:hypothetical protein